MHSLGELKDKPSKVIFMATIAGLWFVLREIFTAPLEITYLAIQISLYAQWQAPRPFASLYFRLAFKFYFKFYRRVTRE
ncbi:hypothetical protein [Campylobacter rectus]|uniref:hypothetical protein n=1 Tax=Campylobacter rectus TaxID=203 RepID=UPI0023F244D4|nr:hypothetical protein [Campylobacter rectus]